MKIDYKILMKAMSWMFVPTLSALLILFFWFLDWGKFIDFITSDGIMASLLRVSFILIELFVVWTLYNMIEVSEQEAKRNTERQLATALFFKNPNQGQLLKHKKDVDVSYSSNVRDLIGEPEGRFEAESYKEIFDDEIWYKIVLKPKNKN